MSMIQRQFRQIAHKTHDLNFQIQPLSTFLHNNVIIVLGAPGLGKTTVFKEYSKTESNALFVRIGELLTATNLTAYEDKILYLDGLDEQRSKFHGKGVMDALISKLRNIAPPKIRISCRTAEWHSSQDVSAIGELFPGSDVCQLMLEPVSDNELVQLLSEEDDIRFIAGAKEHNLEELLSNPGDFILLKKYYQEVNDWPDTRTELMQVACLALLKEVNLEHYDQLDDNVNNIKLLRSSEYLSAIMMLSGIDGIATSRLNSNKNYPSIHELDDDIFCMKVAANHNLFKPIGTGRIESRHRKISEYMAARYLARRVKEGLSLRRLMTLLTGFDGKTAPDLRGVYAWMVTLLSGSAEKILHHDPYGAVIYGDTYSWTPQTKITALKLLEELSLKDPWFRQQDYSVKELGGLACVATVDYLSNLIKTGTRNSHLLSVVFDAISISNDPGIIKLEECLLVFIQDSKNPGHLRRNAVNALKTATNKPQVVLMELIDEVSKKIVSDDEQYLIGSLLDYLYPTVISPSKIIDYLVKPNSGYIGTYYMFVVNDIFKKTPIEQLPILANNSRQLKSCENIGSARTEFLNQLSLKVITSFYKSATLDAVYSWLELTINEYDSSTLDQKQKLEFNSLLAAEKSKLFRLFIYHVDKFKAQEKNAYQLWWRFNELTSHSLDAEVFLYYALVFIKENHTIESSAILFELLCSIFMNIETSNVHITFEELECVAKTVVGGDKILKKSTFCPLDDNQWRVHDAKRKKERLEKKQRRLDENQKEISNHREDIKSGDAIGILIHYSKIWLGRFSDVDQNILPKERLIQEVGSDNINDLLDGFTSVINKDVFYSVQEIAETDLEGKSFHVQSLMLTAMEVIFELNGKNDLLLLPDEKLELAIAYFLSSHSSREADWFELLRDSKPNIYASVQEEYWRFQLNKKPSRLHSIYAFREADPDFEIKMEIIPRLLNDYPKLNPTILNDMLINTVGVVSRDKMLPLVRRSLDHRKHFRKNFTKSMWLSVGYTIDTVEFCLEMKRELQVNPDSKWIMKKFLFKDIFNKDCNGSYIRNAKYRKGVLVILGKYFNNVHDEIGGGVRAIGSRDEASATRDIITLIQTFSNDTSDDSSVCLDELLSDKNLSVWNSDVIYAKANHIRIIREAKFTYPGTENVVNTLSNIEPANVSDLKALIIDTLYEIADEIRNGNTDQYKQFWNIGNHSKATDIHIDENTSRDRLLDLLRLKLKHLDIVAEP